VYIEKGEYVKAIEIARKAVEEGRRLRADSKTIARAFGLMGSAYTKLGNLTKAIESYGNSIPEQGTPDMLVKLHEVEQAKAESDRRERTEMETAIESYRKSIAEHREPDIFRELGKAMSKADMSGYTDEDRAMASVIVGSKDGARESQRSRAELENAIRGCCSEMALFAPSDPQRAPDCFRLSSLLGDLYLASDNPKHLTDAVAAIDCGFGHCRGHEVEAQFWAKKARILELGGKETEAQVRAAIECHQTAAGLCDQNLQAGRCDDRLCEAIYLDTAAANITLCRLTRNEEHGSTAIDFCRKAQSLTPSGSQGTIRQDATLLEAFMARSEVKDRPFCDDPLWTESGPSQIRNFSILVSKATHCLLEAHQAQKRYDRKTAERLLLTGASILAEVKRQKKYISSAFMEDCLVTLGDIDYGRFQISGDKTCIDDAILTRKWAAGVSQKPYLHELGAAECLTERYWTYYDPADVEDAVQYATAAGRKLPPGNGEIKGEWLRVEGRALIASSEVHRKRDILEDAVKDLEQATGLLRQKSRSLALAYQGLGTAYSLLEAFGHSQANLYEAMKALETARAILWEQSATQDSSDPDIAMLNNSFGMVMLRRSIANQDSDALKSAVSYFRASYEKLDCTHPQYAIRVGNYCQARGMLYEHDHPIDILKEADGELERALSGPFSLPANTVNVSKVHRGMLSLEIFRATHDERELEKAIENLKSGLNVKGLSRVFQISALGNLGISLGMKAKMSRRHEDLVAAFKAFKDAEALCPCDEPEHWIIRYNETKLRNDIHTKLGGLGGNSFGRQALASYAQLLDEVSLSTSHRFICADAAAKLAHGFGRSSEASRTRRKPSSCFPSFSPLPLHGPSF